MFTNCIQCVTRSLTHTAQTHIAKQKISIEQLSSINIQLILSFSHVKNKTDEQEREEEKNAKSVREELQKVNA